ncbi:MAG: hypothetical protein OEX10_07225, partial [Candidatus Bathyarchaeota archaeon]|nr:hypothetical protein [Candidatus Bathyarchaeota archaeon]
MSLSIGNAGRRQVSHVFEVRASHRSGQVDVGCFYFLAYTSSMNSVLMLEDMLVIMLAALVY